MPAQGRSSNFLTRQVLSYYPVQVLTGAKPRQESTRGPELRSIGGAESAPTRLPSAPIPRQPQLRVPGGHFDLVAPWSVAWAAVLSLTKDLAR